MLQHVVNAQVACHLRFTCIIIIIIIIITGTVITTTTILSFFFVCSLRQVIISVPKASPIPRARKEEIS